MWFRPFYRLVGVSPMPLDMGYLFLVGSNILLSVFVQEWVVILEFTQKMSTCPSTPPPWERGELLYDPAIPVLVNKCPHKNLYTNVHSSFIHTRQKVETTRMSIHRWMDKCCVHTMEYYCAINRNEGRIHVTTWMNLQNIVTWKKSDTKGHIQYDSIYETCLE